MEKPSYILNFLQELVQNDSNSILIKCLKCIHNKNIDRIYVIYKTEALKVYQKAYIDTYKQELLICPECYLLKYYASHNPSIDSI